MKRLTIATLLTTIALGAAGAEAGGGANEYQGRAERDPNSYFGFDLKGDKVKIVRAILNYSCSNGDSDRFGLQADGSIKVKNDRFSGKLDLLFPQRRGLVPRGGTNVQGTYKVEGELGRRGKAKGTIDAAFTYEQQPMNPARAGDTETVRCYSGRLDWKAKKGADTLPPS